MLLLVRVDMWWMVLGANLAGGESQGQVEGDSDVLRCSFVIE